MTHVNCPRCGLVLALPRAGAIESCPRCLARDRCRTPFIVSSAPARGSRASGERRLTRDRAAQSTAVGLASGARAYAGAPAVVPASSL